jgi:hypothetical protein
MDYAIPRYKIIKDTSGMKLFFIMQVKEQMRDVS